jgi:hypothetical protein
MQVEQTAQSGRRRRRGTSRRAFRRQGLRDIDDRLVPRSQCNGENGPRLREGLFDLRTAWDSLLPDRPINCAVRPLVAQRFTDRVMRRI